MNASPRYQAELRDWIKCAAPSDTFQGRLFNDITHRVDGTFVTLEADEVTWCGTDCFVHIGASIYALWNSYKRKEKDLFDEN